VPIVDHHSYDGELFARSWLDTAFARDRSLAFACEPVQLTRCVDEYSLPDADLAQRHDDPERLAWLANRLVGATKDKRPAAILLPPWLGLVRGRAEELSQRVGVPCGEALLGPGGPSGLRFERARDRALERVGVTVLNGRVRKVERTGSGWLIELGDDRDVIVADVVVLALGGLVGGGLAYTPAGSVFASALPPHALAVARVTVDAPVTLAAFHKTMETPGSLYGGAPESHAWPTAEDPLLDRVGIAVDDAGRVTGAPTSLLAAGDIVADRPRTWLEALAAGARAGATAARTDPLT
jgi:glycerol-3-phosphate dehydrogenase subunit B